MSARICIARIGAAHGVRGEVRLWPFTEDPSSVAAYGALQTKDGARQFTIRSLRAASDHLVVTLDGVTTRDEAERLNGLELYVAREKLPPTASDEFYHADLIGLAAVTAQNERIGDIVAVHNFGAGDIIEIRPADGGQTLMLPFSKAVVPTVDLAAGRAVIVPPGEIEGETSAESEPS